MKDIRLPLEDFLTMDSARGQHPNVFKGKRIIVIEMLLPLNDFLILDTAGGQHPNVFLRENLSL